MTLAQRALDRLATWQDLSAGPASCGTGRALRGVRAEIAHFHSERDVDLHLTRRAVQRFHYDLGDSSAIHLVPGSGWVTVHLDCEADVDLLLSLVSIALKAHETRPLTEHLPLDRCNFHRVAVLPRNATAEG
ncbi:luciferase family protein [Streptomyces bullii]|uniref:Luciferase family protein n=1 Tax=Streptomyces bullii TaxID=349910 RepID=A0ABW0UJZ4_9ACTN